MFSVVFGDIHIDDLQNIFSYDIMDITKSNGKNDLENISTNLTLWLGVYKIHNKQFVEIISLSKFPIF
jgi:hypothetical protein